MIQFKKEDLPEQAHIACLPTKHIKKPTIASSIRECGKCGQDVWITPETLKILESNKLNTVVCMECLDYKDIEDVACPSPGQLKEILEHIAEVKKEG